MVKKEQLIAFRNAARQTLQVVSNSLATINPQSQSLSEAADDLQTAFMEVVDNVLDHIEKEQQ